MNELDELLSQMTGRHVTVKDVQNGLGMAKGTYYTQRDEGRLHQPANLLKLARAFGVNPVELLVHYGHLSANEVGDYAKNLYQEINRPAVIRDDNLVLLSPEKIVEVVVDPKTGGVQHAEMTPTGQKLTPDEMVAAMKAALDTVQVQLRQHAEALDALRSREAAARS